MLGMNGNHYKRDHGTRSDDETRGRLRHPSTPRFESSIFCKCTEIHDQLKVIRDDVCSFSWITLTNLATILFRSVLITRVKQFPASFDYIVPQLIRRGATTSAYNDEIRDEGPEEVEIRRVDSFEGTRRPCPLVNSVEQPFDVSPDHFWQQRTDNLYRKQYFAPLSERERERNVDEKGM